MYHVTGLPRSTAIEADRFNEKLTTASPSPGRRGSSRPDGLLLAVPVLSPSARSALPPVFERMEDTGSRVLS